MISETYIWYGHGNREASFVSCGEGNSGQAVIDLGKSIIGCGESGSRYGNNLSDLCRRRSYCNPVFYIKRLRNRLISRHIELYKMIAVFCFRDSKSNCECIGLGKGAGCRNYCFIFLKSR